MVAKVASKALGNILVLVLVPVTIRLPFQNSALQGMTAFVSVVTHVADQGLRAFSPSIKLNTKNKTGPPARIFANWQLILHSSKTNLLAVNGLICTDRRYRPRNKRKKRKKKEKKRCTY